MDQSRRWFLTRSAGIGAAFLALKRLPKAASGEARSVGGLRRDKDGIIGLPDGFSYTIVSRTGDEMDDGLLVPAAPDGMASFPGPDGKTIVVRNHELLPDDTGPFGESNERLSLVDENLIYDRRNGAPCQGGTTTFVFDAQNQRVERQFLSLAGTERNCAGGPTPWNSWVTCEESTNRAGKKYEKDHGFAFEVPAAAQGPVEPVPLTDMGRFYHEAIAVDPESGVVYLTEDRPDGLFYRFLPKQAGNLAAGGRLQALKIRHADSVDTRNWNRFGSFPLGEPVEAGWVALKDVDSPKDDLRYRGFVRGAARFARGEGLWYGNGAVYFTCTIGGKSQRGQIWRFLPSPHEGTRFERKERASIELLHEPNDLQKIDMCDNLTVAPWGDLFLCEDGFEPDNFILRVTPDGTIHRFARNEGKHSEFAGANFSPDGSTLFVNIQFRPGLTLAITGPWEEFQSR